MNKYYITKVVLSILALLLWIASLFFPVWKEGHADTIYSGGWILLLTFTTGIIFLFGITLGYFEYQLIRSSIR